MILMMMLLVGVKIVMEHRKASLSIKESLLESTSK